MVNVSFKRLFYSYLSFSGCTGSFIAMEHTYRNTKNDNLMDKFYQYYTNAALGSVSGVTTPLYMLYKLTNN